MKNFIYLFLSLWLWACQGNAQKSFEDLSAKEFEQKITQNSDALVLDVRTAQEFAEGCLNNAQNIDITQGDFEQKIANLDKSKAVFVYCRSGKRSARACQILKESGFKNVHNLDGGISAWQAAGLAVKR